MSESPIPAEAVSEPPATLSDVTFNAESRPVPEGIQLDDDREYVAGCIQKQCGVPSHEAIAAAVGCPDAHVQEIASAGRAGDVARVRSLLGCDNPR